jgi:hypothetical protein
MDIFNHSFDIHQNQNQNIIHSNNHIQDSLNNSYSNTNIFDIDQICIFTGKNGNRNITKIIGISNYIPLHTIKDWIQMFKKTLHCNVYIDKDKNINLHGNHSIFLSKFLKDNNITNFSLKGVL